MMVPNLPARSDDEQLVDAVEAQAAGLPVRLQVVRYDPTGFSLGGLDRRSSLTAGEWAAAAVMWIDLEPDAYTIYFYETDGARLLRRRIPVDEGSTAAALESVTNIAGSVLAESLQGPIHGMPEVEPHELAPEPPPTEPKPPPTRAPPRVVARSLASFARLWLSLGYSGNTFSSEVPWQNAVFAAVAWSPVAGAFVGLRYDLVFRSRVKHDLVAFDLWRHPVTAFGGYRFALRRGWDVQVLARGTVDPIVRKSIGRTSALPVRGDAVRVFSSLGGGVGFGYRPIRQVRLGITVGADALLTRADYVSRAPEQTVLVHPHPARFFVDAGLDFGLVWSDRRKARARRQRD